MTTCPTPDAGWPMHRILFLLAGTVTLVGVGLGALVSPWFLLLAALPALNQLLFVAVGWCPMSLLLRRFGVPEPARHQMDYARPAGKVVAPRQQSSP